MIVRRLATSALVLACGYAIAGGLFWLLLNVPESNVVALLASAVAFLSVIVCAGLATAAALTVPQGGPTREIIRRAVRTLPLFLLGLVIFAALWWLTARVDSWWSAHRGETDAIMLRYLGLTNTNWLHLAATWLIWLVRWGLGLSSVAAFSAAGASGKGQVTSGLRGAVRLAPLAMAVAAALIVSQGVWRWVYWRPAGLSPSYAELAFVVVKLGVLYLMVAALGAAVLDVHRRAVKHAA
jgi:hypothetical protein